MAKLLGFSKLGSKNTAVVSFSYSWTVDDLRLTDFDKWSWEWPFSCGITFGFGGKASFIYNDIFYSSSSYSE